jgi:hypothetical protein
VSYIVRHEANTSRVVYRYSERERVVAVFYDTHLAVETCLPVDGVEQRQKDAEALAAKLNERLAAALQQQHAMRDAAIKAQRITERGRPRR